MCRRRASKSSSSSGQAIVFVLMALLILVFALFWNVDLHRILAGKNRAQNAGDSAALAAAKWQGAALNLVGELNLLHALALSEGDDEAEDAITNAQARLTFTGPMVALAMAQIAAKNNKIYSDPDFTASLREHAEEVLDYGVSVDGLMALPEPYDGAWEDYSGMITAIAEEGVAAAPDNAKFYGDVTSGHILLDKQFYEAVAGQTWCWFFLNCATGSGRTILDDFTDYSYFDPIPEPDPPDFVNSEIFGLGVEPRTLALKRLHGVEDAMRAAADSEWLAQVGGATNVVEFPTVWYFYSHSIWQLGWPGMNPDGPDPLPLSGPVKKEYDYTGADAVTRLSARTYRLSKSNDTGSDILWIAAAKPFGYLELEDAESGKVQPNAFGLVLPAFKDARLIPVDAATSGGDGSFDLKWRRHTDEHLPIYVQNGAVHDSCSYCLLIKRFEDAAFRAAGSRWLQDNSSRCTPPSGPGTTRGSGTRRGH